jgi:hypothetical protein
MNKDNKDKYKAFAANSWGLAVFSLPTPSLCQRANSAFA